MTTPTEKSVVGRFFEYRAAAMQSLVDATREIIQHALTKGVEAEGALAEMLASLLPAKFDARKGFVIDSAGAQSNELDLVIVDRDHIARMFDFRAFELVPIEAASSCIEIKTHLDKKELDGTFDRFQRIQDMRFLEERVVRGRGTGLVLATTSRPELVLFAYDASVSKAAVRKAYERHPALATVKICVLNKGIVADIVASPAGALGLRWIEPIEKKPTSFAGAVLALFLYQFFLPALFDQTKGVGFYTGYLGGEADYLELR